MKTWTNLDSMAEVCALQQDFQQCCFPRPVLWRHDRTNWSPWLMSGGGSPSLLELEEVGSSPRGSQPSPLCLPGLEAAEALWPLSCLSHKGIVPWANRWWIAQVFPHRGQLSHPLGEVHAKRPHPSWPGPSTMPHTSALPVWPNLKPPSSPQLGHSDGVCRRLPKQWFSVTTPMQLPLSKYSALQPLHIAHIPSTQPWASDMCQWMRPMLMSCQEGLCNTARSFWTAVSDPPLTSSALEQVLKSPWVATSIFQKELTFIKHL